MKACLVTGGAGFIGSHLAEALLHRPHRVIIVDALDEEYSSERKHRNLAEIAAAGRPEFVLGDIRDRNFLESVMVAHRPDTVFHLAALPGVRASVQRPALCLDHNVQGTASVLNAAHRAGVRKVVFASSSSVYGIGRPIPFLEDVTPTLPISPYAASKLAAESLCHVYARLHGLSITCLRLFTVYGPRQRPDLAIAKFINAIDSGREISVFGNGDMVREYTYCSDVVDAFLAAAALESPFDIINVGGGQPVSLITLLGTLEQLVGRPARICHCDHQPGDVDATAADLIKARRLLGYHPRVELAAGLQRQVAWVRAN